MILYKGYHPIHFEVLSLEKVTNRDFSNMGKGDTQKIIVFKNGYGASIIRGFASFGNFELAVLKFENMKKMPRSRKKRVVGKFNKSLGPHTLVYDTPISDSIKRYAEESDTIDDLNTISNFKVNQF